jgi:hypothetical protein
MQKHVHCLYERYATKPVSLLISCAGVPLSKKSTIKAKDRVNKYPTGYLKSLNGGIAVKIAF